MSLRDLLAADAAAPLDDDELDDTVWLTLVDRIGGVGGVDRLPPLVAAWFVTRFVEWEVMNGGFAQLAGNDPDALARAPAAYEALGRPGAAALVRRAAARVAAGPADGEAFTDDEFEDLDDEAWGSDDFAADDARTAIVRANRALFADAGL